MSPKDIKNNLHILVFFGSLPFSIMAVGIILAFLFGLIKATSVPELEITSSRGHSLSSIEIQKPYQIVLKQKAGGIERTSVFTVDTQTKKIRSQAENTQATVAETSELNFYVGPDDSVQFNGVSYSFADLKKLTGFAAEEEKFMMLVQFHFAIIKVQK